MRRLFAVLSIVLLHGCTDSGSPAGPEWPAVRVDDQPSRTPVAVKAADMDGDGDLDIVSAWRGVAATTQPASGAVAGAIAIHFQQSAAVWTTVIVDSGARYAQVNALVLGDVNRDERPDIVVADMDRIVYLRAPAAPTVANQWVPYDIQVSIGTGLTAWYDVAIAQIDAQQGPDIVAALGPTTGGRVSWLRAPANPDQAENWELIDIDRTRRAGSDSVLAVDLNGDARIDVISSAPGETTDGITWYEQPLDPVAGAWVRHPMSNFDGATRLALGDLNNDGRVDLAAISPKSGKAGAAWLIQPAQVTARWGGWLVANYATSLDGRTPTDVAVADVNRDGQNDIIVATSSPGAIDWLTPGEVNTQFWTATRLITYNRPAPALIGIGDIDLDEWPDVIATVDDTTNSRDRVEWLQNITAAETQPAP